MFDLDNFIKHGLITDLIKAEESLRAVNIIGEYSDEINNADKDITYTFALLQKTCLHEYVLAIARIYDKKSNRNRTRCLETLIHKLKDEPKVFPEIGQSIQTKNHIRFYELNPSLIESLEQENYLEFTRRLGFTLFSQFHKLEQERKIVKSWRDKILAHNDEHNKVDKIVFKEVNKLLDFGWKVATIVGWAYLNTVYGFEGKNDLRQDTSVKVSKVEKLIKKLITPHNRVDAPPE